MKVATLKPFIQRLLQNTAFGLFLGSVLAFALSFALEASVEEDAKKLYTFIVSALISLLAASLTLVGVFANIDNQDRLANDLRVRKLKAAKAFLPSSLSKMCDLCRDGIHFSHKFDDFVTSSSVREFEQSSLKRLIIPSDVAMVFRDIVELTDDEVVADRLAGALREYQIFYSRWRGVFQDAEEMLPPSTYAIRQRTVAWAYLYAIFSSVFDYSRGMTSTIETDVTTAEINSALNTCGVRGILAEDFGEEIGLYARTFDRRFKR